MLIDEYGSVRKGKIYRAWNSPHQTGLGIDLEGNGLTSLTRKISIKKQEMSDAFKWLKENAYKYGINPYKEEPWHWECLVPRNNFITGEDFTGPDPLLPYNARIIETSKTKPNLTTTSLKWTPDNPFT